MIEGLEFISGQKRSTETTDYTVSSIELEAVKRSTQIEFEPQFIPKILSGTQTVTIRRTPRVPGIYEIVNSETKEVAGSIEILNCLKTEKKYIQPIVRGAEWIKFELIGMLELGDAGYRLLYSFCGFNDKREFHLYHETRPVFQYFHQFTLLKDE